MATQWAAGMKAYFYAHRRNPDEVREAMQKAVEQRRQAIAALREKHQQERSIAQKARDYLTAEAKHAWGGPAPVQVFEERMRLCMACPGRVDELDNMRDDGGIGFCTKCGCGANQRSQLSVKLTLAGIECPLGKFGKVEGTGGTIASAVEAAKGVASNVLTQLRRAIR